MKFFTFATITRVFIAAVAALIISSTVAQDSLSIGANVNMVSGQAFPAGDPFQRQQNEPSVAYSSRNSLHLLSGANDYRAVDVPGLPGGRETGDSWLSYFWSTNGGATWKSTLMPGYPQDPACLGDNPPVLCDYAAGADPVVRAGVNGMFYYSGIVFDRSEPSRSAIFVSRFIDLNNDEGGDPIRYIDTTIIDANNDGSVFLDKSWIEVDIPRDTATETISVLQRDGSSVNQTIACGNVYVGYAAIGGEGQDLRSEIRMATSADCGNVWDIQPVSQPDTLNQGANIAIHPLTGEVHVAWRRFDTVESFLGISPTGCPASPSSWEVNSDWPVSSIEVGGVTYTIAEAQELLGSKHRGDESIKLAYEVIAAKLNLLTGGGDPVDGFNPWQWSQDLNAFIDDAEAWFVDNPIGSDPKQQGKQDGKVIKKNIQEILQGSGSCSGDSEGTPASSTGETNAIIVTSSDDLGETFSTPTVIDESSTFDQGSTRFSFRTTAYPTVAADADGRIYVAWAARGYASIRNQVSDGDSRIVLSTSTDGTNWSNPYAVDEPNRQGHQIKPSLLFAGGQLTLVFYDFRQDVSNIFEGFVVDIPDGTRLRHTVDVRLATALPAAAPVFTDYSLLSSSEPVKPSSSASRYSFVAYGDPGNVQTLQVEYMVPNYPMFADGTTPFIGDYVDVAAPNLINDEGTWRFASNVGDVQVWQAVWSDNRNVIPPPDGDWSKYVAPITQAQPSFFDPLVTIPSCNDVNFPDALPQFQAGSLYTGTRNQNVYSASISNGVIVAAPGNNRPLDGFDDFNMPLKRSFVVYVQNTTRESRTFNVSLPSIPFGIKASLALNAAVTTKDIEIPPYSSAVVTVFASLDGAPTTEAIPVSVVEVGGTLAATVILNSDSEAPDPLTNSLLTSEVHNPAILNPAILNPAILNATVDAAAEMTCTDDPDKCLLFPEVYNPAILNPAILNPAILNPAILNPAIFNPAILNPAIFNPAILNPAILNPAIMNPAILNPAILNPAIFNPAIFNPAILNPAILNPAIMNPAILNPAILNPAILNPAILNPAILNPAILNPAILNTTVSEEARQVDVTFAVVNEGNATTAYDLNLAAPQIEGLDYELFVYLLNETPVAQGCELTTEAQQLLVLSQDDPLNNDLDGSFYLEPGQQVLVTFRVLPDVNADVPLNPVTNFDVADLGGLVTAQPINTDPATQPPADEFGLSANIVPGTAGGALIGAGGTFPVNAGTLNIGDQVTITASGFVIAGPGFVPSTPDGSGIACNTACLLPGAPAFSLIARIGNEPWEFVGEGPIVITASNAGELELAVNDNGYNDNSGAFSVSVTSYIAPTPIGLWKGDGDALDSVGTNDGTLFGGATFSPGIENQSFVFDGVNSYMNIGQPLLESAGTVAFWVRRNGPISSGSDVFFGGVGPNLQRTPTLFVRSGGTLLWEFNNITLQNTGIPINVGQWYNVAMSWDSTGGGADLKIWVDGVLVDSWSGAATPTDFQANVLVGAYQDNGSVNQYANASIDELMVYDSALTTLDVLNLFGFNGSSDAPVITVPTSPYTIVAQTVAGAGTFGNDPNLFVSVTDDLDPTVSLTCDAGFDSVTGNDQVNLNFNFPGILGQTSDTTVTCTATDSDGNQTVESFIVTVDDTVGLVWRGDFNLADQPDPQLPGPYVCVRVGVSPAIDNFPAGSDISVAIFDEDGGPQLGAFAFTFPSETSGIGNEIFLSGTQLSDGIGFAIITLSDANTPNFTLEGRTGQCIGGGQTGFVDATMSKVN